VGAERAVRIDVVRSGGFAGRTTRASVDTASLDPERAAAIQEALARADLAELAERSSPGRARPGRGADRFQYDVTVRDGVRRYRLTLREDALTPELKRLVSLAFEYGRT
jgi:hypothetical protein